MSGIDFNEKQKQKKIECNYEEHWQLFFKKSFMQNFYFHKFLPIA